ncbi:MAG: peptidoglycan editing factor PgeF [Pseudomonadota bacterium]
MSDRRNGVSKAPYTSLNVATHVGDDAERVCKNREHLHRLLPGDVRIAWLNQVHGTRVVEANVSTQTPAKADALWTGDSSMACAIMTADCLPVLFCDTQGRKVAAAHAGWRGLLEGVLPNTVTHMGSDHKQLYAWIGPAISQKNFEVGPEVRDAFLRHWSLEISDCFRPGVRKGAYLANLRGLAEVQLRAMGVSRITHDDRCSFDSVDALYSYRRDGVTGRNVSLIFRQ